jgi:phosphatidylglycerol:prolipoprotein diacylglycerol transferase
MIFAEIPYPRIDPVAIDLPGPIDIRWYGLMYLVGFVAGYAILRQLIRRGWLPMTEAALSDLVTAAIVGVIAGGRLGYMLFYDLPDLLREPARLLRIWEGGMSFHGGLIGMLLAVAWTARRHRLPFLRLGDAVALAVPPGIFAVRIANFINGELYGRVASPEVPWAMRFPTDPVAERLLGVDTLPLRARELAIKHAYETGLWDRVRPFVPLRHPSQLYEALGEGLLVGLVVWGLYRAFGRTDRWPPGALGGAFLIAYGTVRFGLEFFRQPDPQFRNPGDPLGTVLGPFTMGQVLCFAMILAGAAVMVLAWRRARRGGDHAPRAPAAATAR